VLGYHFPSPENRMPRLCQGKNGDFRHFVCAATPICQSFRRPSVYACALATDGGGIASRLIGSRIAANSCRGAATSVGRNITYFDCGVIFVRTFSNFFRNIASEASSRNRTDVTRLSRHPINSTVFRRS
jgi:hypothetical protein